jgi:hypothetical protein
MYPWGHLAVGYLGYTVGRRLGDGQPPDERPTLVLVCATQLPDLVDKTLQFGFGVYDGRAVGHSLLVVAPVCLGLLLVARRRRRTALGVAFAVGVGTHLLGDSWRALLSGSVRPDATYLLWPLLAPPTYPISGPEDHVERLLATLDGLGARPFPEVLAGVLGLKVALLVATGVVWVADGFPGCRAVYRAVRGRVS